MLEVQGKRRLIRGAGRQPLYAALAELLISDIASGTYKPLSTLPTEQELTELHAVSRQTVRQALRILRDRGLISSHPGVGTIVRESVDVREVFRAVNSTQDLLQFVSGTEMHAVSRQERLATAELASVIGCKVGETISEAAFLRKTPGSTLPMSYVVVYVHPMYSQAQDAPAVSNIPIYKRIEQLYSIKIHEIQQDVTATLLDEQTASLLKTEPGEAALRITRFFFDTEQTQVQVSISYYPSSRYTQSARFRATDMDFS